MTKRKNDDRDLGKETKDENLSAPPRAKKVKVTLESDPTISTDHAKISSLISQLKTWRFWSFDGLPNRREIANYYPDQTAETIKKRYQLCTRVLRDTFSPEDVPLALRGVAGVDVRMPN
jgi:hypothetical protein